MLQVCNNPKLVLKKDHPLFDSIVADYLGGNHKNILNIGKYILISDLQKSFLIECLVIQ